jgi:uncharacterized membrane protein YphA (DoxX/SURF4 family)
MTTEARGNLGRLLLIIGRLALAAVFLVAAYAKMKPPVSTMPWSLASVNSSLSLFAMQVDSYELLPTAAVNFVAHTLPPFELLLGLWLLTGIALRYSSLLTTLLIGGFFAVVVRSYMVGLEINCGCFGPGEKLGPRKIAEDGALLALSLAVTVGAFLIQRKRSQAIPSEASPAIPQGD